MPFRLPLFFSPRSVMRKDGLTFCFRPPTVPPWRPSLPGLSPAAATGALLPLLQEQAVHQVALLPRRARGQDPCVRAAAVGAARLAFACPPRVSSPHRLLCRARAPPAPPLPARAGIYDIGNKRAEVKDFPLVVHLVSNELEQVRGAVYDHTGGAPHVRAPPLLARRHACPPCVSPLSPRARSCRPRRSRPGALPPTSRW